METRRVTSHDTSQICMIRKTEKDSGVVLQSPSELSLDCEPYAHRWSFEHSSSMEDSMEESVTMSRSTDDGHPRHNRVAADFFFPEDESEDDPHLLVHEDSGVSFQNYDGADDVSDIDDDVDDVCDVNDASSANGSATSQPMNIPRRIRGTPFSTNSTPKRNAHSDPNPRHYDSVAGVQKTGRKVSTERRDICSHDETDALTDARANQDAFTGADTATDAFKYPISRSQYQKDFAQSTPPRQDTSDIDDVRSSAPLCGSPSNNLMVYRHRSESYSNLMEQGLKACARAVVKGRCAEMKRARTTSDSLVAMRGTPRSEDRRTRSLSVTYVDNSLQIQKEIGRRLSRIGDNFVANPWSQL